MSLANGPIWTYGIPLWGTASQSNIEIRYDTYLAAIGLTPGGSSTAHMYTQTVHRIEPPGPLNLQRGRVSS